VKCVFIVVKRFLFTNKVIEIDTPMIGRFLWKGKSVMLKEDNN
jgi:hypothetical protein